MTDSVQKAGLESRCCCEGPHNLATSACVGKPSQLVIPFAQTRSIETTLLFVSGDYILRIAVVD